MQLSLESIARLEDLIDQLLAERADLMERNEALSAEHDRLMNDRSRINQELGELLDKLERLERG